LSDTYPNITTLLSVDPDFLYASYPSAFSNSSIDYQGYILEEDDENGHCDLLTPSGDTIRAFCRAELQSYGIQTYLQTAFCELVEHRPEDVTLETGLYKELRDIASIFGVSDRAESLIIDIEDHFSAAVEVSSGGGGVDSGMSAPRVLWLDSFDDDEPYVGACCGSVQLIMDFAGAENIFDGLGAEERLTWENAPWEDIVAADPDVIVLVDASWDTAGKVDVLIDCIHVNGTKCS
jgi:iron complex transport system substrate-binding protein